MALPPVLFVHSSFCMPDITCPHQPPGLLHRSPPTLAHSGFPQPRQGRSSSSQSLDRAFRFSRFLDLVCGNSAGNSRDYRLTIALIRMPIPVPLRLELTQSL